MGDATTTSRLFLLPDPETYFDGRSHASCLNAISSVQMRRGSARKRWISAGVPAKTRSRSAGSPYSLNLNTPKSINSGCASRNLASFSSSFVFFTFSKDHVVGSVSKRKLKDLKKWHYNYCTMVDGKLETIAFYKIPNEWENSLLFQKVRALDRPWRLQGAKGKYVEVFQSSPTAQALPYWTLRPAHTVPSVTHDRIVYFLD